MPIIYCVPPPKKTYIFIFLITPVTLYTTLVTIELKSTSLGRDSRLVQVFMNIREIKLLVLDDRPVFRGFFDLLLADMKLQKPNFFGSYIDYKKAVSTDSLGILATHLLPPDASIDDKKSGHQNFIYGENFTPKCLHWWIDRGATGLWDLRDSVEDCKVALQAILHGEVGYSPTIQKILTEEEAKYGLHKLSKREMQVAQLLVVGRSTRDVAKELGTTEGTIKNQRKAVYKKLGIIRATQLPAAMGNGYAHPKK